MKTVSKNQKQFAQWTLEYQKKKEEADRLFARISTFRILTFLIGAAALIIGMRERKIIFRISDGCGRGISDRICCACEMA